MRTYAPDPMATLTREAQGLAQLPRRSAPKAPLRDLLAKVKAPKSVPVEELLPERGLPKTSPSS